MAKFMILYSSTVPAKELMANSTPEEMKASMNEWMSWQDEASKTIKLEWGLPLQASDRITPDGITTSDCEVSGYATAEADSKEMVTELFKSHPHLKRQGAYIDVLEMLSMPGIDS